MGTIEDQKKLTGGKGWKAIKTLSKELKDNIWTDKKQVPDGQGGYKEEVTTTNDPVEINKKIIERLDKYDFEGTLNSSTSVNLYANALQTNLKKLETQMRKTRVPDGHLL